MILNLDQIDVEAYRAEKIAAYPRSPTFYKSLTADKLRGWFATEQFDPPEDDEFHIDSINFESDSVVVSIQHGILSRANVIDIMDMVVIHGGETHRFSHLQVEKDTITEGGTYYDDPASTYPVAWMEFVFKL